MPRTDPHVLTLTHHGDDLIGVAHVGRDREALAAGFLDPAERLRWVSSRPLIDADERAFGCEPDRGGPADSGRRSGDEGNLAFEPSFHWILRGRMGHWMLSAAKPALVHSGVGGSSYERADTNLPSRTSTTLTPRTR